MSRFSPIAESGICFLMCVTDVVWKELTLHLFRITVMT